MTSPPDPRHDHHYLEQVIEQTRTTMRGLRQAKHLIGQVEGTGEGAQGMIRAAADGRGGLTRIELNPRALRLDVATLGAAVTEAVQAAQGDATRRTAEIVAEAVGGAGALPEPLDETFVRARVDAAARDLYSAEL
ncbi:YbaB/EbfC family nucleoid-associated protein [Nonomuraea sp. NPDC049714]|uniref:YbaB/EbfC family nucleoid-associated protein n=1 Tax=Nonomuraea sp. NPDC049714 TaxID=3364357 RepID=UPI003795B7C3